MVPLHVIGIIIHTAGTVLIGFAALAVHHDVMKEHRIDREVVQTMKMEAKLAIAGIVMVIVGNSLSVIEALGLV